MSDLVLKFYEVCEKNMRKAVPNMVKLRAVVLALLPTKKLRWRGVQTAPTGAA